MSQDEQSSAAGAPGLGSWPPLPEPLPSPVVDSHCHLDMAFDPVDSRSAMSLNDALHHAATVGVSRVVQIGCDEAGAEWAVAAAAADDRVLAGVALHPNEAPRLAARNALAPAMSLIESLAMHPRVRAIGETGLDYFRTPESGRPAQEDSFRWHIDLAKRTGKALVIHDRDAHDAVVRVLLEEGAPERVVFHCFSGNAALARVCAEHGWVMSFAGTVTFRSAEGVREGLEVAPIDLLLVETDAPFLAPTPFRGRPNSSYLIPLTIRAMSQVKGVETAEMCEAVNATSTRVFGRW